MRSGKIHIARCVANVMLCCMMLVMITGTFLEPSYAAATTITLKIGKMESYGAKGYRTAHRWVSHVNGDPVDLRDEPGVTTSYAYCVQPAKDTPPAGTYNVTVIDDDDTGRVARMRKMIYYLPGAYGYKKVTKKRWFSTTTEGASDYAIGHIALSFMYDYCSESTDAWIGCGSGIKNKVKHMIDDLKNLPDPPDDFEVFWIKVSGMQDTFGAIYDTEYGYVKVRKLSSNTDITKGNDCYSLGGAEYGLFEDEKCTEPVEPELRPESLDSSDGAAINSASLNSSRTATVTTEPDGISDEIRVETGDYYVKELRAPRGYAIDTKVYPVQVNKDKTTTLTAYDTPKSNMCGILIQKQDKETGFPKAQGAASLEGAEYTVTYYDVTPPAGASETKLKSLIDGKEPATKNGKPAQWVFRTDEEGKIDFSKPEKYIVGDKSNSLYRNSKNEPVFPIGIIAVQETKAPKGYLLDERVYVRGIIESGTVERIDTLKPYTGEDSLQEQVIRGDVSFTKSSEGILRMHNVPFRITSLTTGESHVVVTDNNGYADTSSLWNKHSSNTNQGKSEEDGIWFNGYNDEATGAPVSDTLSGLPYDTYKLEELRCLANMGHKLFSDTFEIKKDKFVIDLGTYDNKLVPEEPDKPDTPDAPDKPDKPQTRITEKHGTSPQTGDMSDIYPYVGICCTAIIGIALLTIIRKGDRLKKIRK